MHADLEVVEVWSDASVGGGSSGGGGDRGRGASGCLVCQLVLPQQGV